MRFLFSAPFRTNINMNSLHAVNGAESVAAVIDAAVAASSPALPPGCAWESPWNQADRGELHYSELSEDCLPLTATPLMRLVVNPGFVASATAVAGTPPATEEVVVDRCVVDYYDNTVAIVSVELTLAGGASEAQTLSTVDRWSTAYCSAIIRAIKPFENAILKALRPDKRQSDTAIFMKPEEFHVFLDRMESVQDASEPREEMLWVTRILLASPDGPPIDLLQQWTQQGDLALKTARVGQADIAFCVGNSIVFDPLTDKEASALHSALSICTYFYVLYNVLNHNLRTLFLNVSRIKAVPAATITRVNRTRSHIEFMENEFSDVLMGFQGLRNDISRRLLATWSYDDLVQAVQKKKDAVAKLVDYSQLEKQNRYGRMIESILAAIGGVAILDFILNLFAFSSDRELADDAVIGLVDAPRHLSVDGTLYTVVAFLIFVLILVLRKR